LLFPVNAVVYFKIRHMLHKDWTPSLVGFIFGLIAILFFFYWLVPAAAQYIYKITFNGNLTEIKKVASGLDPSNVDLEKMKQAAPYLNDVNIDALMEMKGIDVQTLRAIKDTGIDAAQIKAAQGVDISRLQAIGDSTKELDAESIREATEMKKMAGDLSQVKEFLRVLEPQDCFKYNCKIEHECVEMLKRAPWNNVPTDKIKFILQCADNIDTGFIPKSNPKQFLQALHNLSQKDFIHMMENADFALNIRRQEMGLNVSAPTVEEVSMDDLYYLKCVRENNVWYLKKILAKCENGELTYYNKKTRSYQAKKTNPQCFHYNTQRSSYNSRH